MGEKQSTHPPIHSSTHLLKFKQQIAQITQIVSNLEKNNFNF